MATGEVTTLAGTAGSSGLRRRHRRGGAVQHPLRCRGGRQRQRLRRGLRQPHHPQDRGGDRGGHDPGRDRGRVRLRRRHRRGGAVLLPQRRGGGRHGQRLRRGHRQPHHPQDCGGDGRGYDPGRDGLFGLRRRHRRGGAVLQPLRRRGGRQRQPLRRGHLEPENPQDCGGDGGGHDPGRERPFGLHGRHGRGGAVQLPRRRRGGRHGQLLRRGHGEPHHPSRPANACRCRHHRRGIRACRARAAARHLAADRHLVALGGRAPAIHFRRRGAVLRHRPQPYLHPRCGRPFHLPPHRLRRRPGAHQHRDAPGNPRASHVAAGGLPRLGGEPEPVADRSRPAQPRLDERVRHPALPAAPEC